MDGEQKSSEAKKPIASIAAVLFDVAAFVCYGAGVGFSYVKTLPALFAYFLAIVFPIAAIVLGIVGLTIKPRTKLSIALSSVAIALPPVLLLLAVLLSNNGVGLIMLM